MIIWIDAQLSPSIAVWIIENFDVKAFALRDSEDEEDLHTKDDLKVCFK